MNTYIDVVQTSLCKFAVEFLKGEGMIIVSKFRCKYIIQVPSGRREHWLLIKIILTKIQTKERDLFVRRFEKSILPLNISNSNRISG